MSEHERNVRLVMAATKCDSKFARRALKATKGQDWIQAARYVEEEIAIRSVSTGPDFTAEDLAKAWS